MIVLLATAGISTVMATPPGNPGVYTLDADFDQGTLVNVNHNAPNDNQLQLDSKATPFEFIWVAASGRGTIIKIDTRTGATLGEYWSAPDGMGRNPSRTTSGVDLTVPDGQYLRVRVQFNRASTGESPILNDLTILANRPPDCSQPAPSLGTIWPANHKFVPIAVLGVTDPDGNPVTITINKIYQDEPVNTTGDGNFTPDGKGVGTSIAAVRAERVGTPKVPGDGRFYHISFTATDSYGLACSGEVLVAVPHDQNKAPVDGGPLYDSTTP